MSPDDALGRLWSAVRDVWPEHGKHLDRTLAALTEVEREHAEAASELVLRIAGGDLRRVCQDYRWLCERMQEEQLHFARSGRYRLSTFQEAVEHVYGDASFMERYLNGLLVGRITWIEQLQMLTLYSREFLPGNVEGYSHLEVGPGHGLLLYLAASDGRCGATAAMDVSAASLAATERCMARLGAPRMPELVARDILADAPREREAWDSIVVSEVLEHLEEPGRALRNLRSWLRPGGRIFITTPVNSPMPDHIYLFHEPGEVLQLVGGAGLEVLRHRFFTAIGVSEEKARKHRLPIACAVIARRPAGAGPPLPGGRSA